MVYGHANSETCSLLFSSLLFSSQMLALKKCCSSIVATEGLCTAGGMCGSSGLRGCELLGKDVLSIQSSGKGKDRKIELLVEGHLLCVHLVSDVAAVSWALMDSEGSQYTSPIVVARDGTILTYTSSGVHVDVFSTFRFINVFWRPGQGL
ncbi:hypothetical protein BC826DRAFT_552380 [Russula brevipes]|nr:hypothetical protein BC826DRAFT_552380 [Russula brevipes]